MKPDFLYEHDQKLYDMQKAMEEMERLKRINAISLPQLKLKDYPEEVWWIFKSDTTKKFDQLREELLG